MDWQFFNNLNLFFQKTTDKIVTQNSKHVIKTIVDFKKLKYVLVEKEKNVDSNWK